MTGLSPALKPFIAPSVMSFERPTCIFAIIPSVPAAISPSGLIRVSPASSFCKGPRRREPAHDDTIFEEIRAYTLVPGTHAIPAHEPRLFQRFLRYPHRPAEG